MYTYVDGNLAISVNDWCEAGLTYRQFRQDSQTGYLKIARRGINGNTLILLDSIRRPDRLRKIEEAFGKARVEKGDIFELSIDTKAREFFSRCVKPDGSPLPDRLQREYVNRASLFETMRRALQTQLTARAAAGGKLKKGEWYKQALGWYIRRCTEPDSPVYGTKPYTNVRSLERAFKAYLKDGYASLLSGKLGNDQARVVSRSVENLLLSLWRSNDKPFVSRVHELYLEFISGNTELYDKETGEVFRPADFIVGGKAPDISRGTVWNYLKDVVNNTAVYADRNGNFDYVNRMRPKHNRKPGSFALSKISMDDVALSRKSTRGWVYKYIAVDVVSGYYFRPAYVVGKPTLETVLQAFRNMFCELLELGLPMPGELEVEHHLMKDISWLGEAFPFVRFCSGPTEKRAEHAIRSLKWTVAKDGGHTRGRWYARHEAYRCVRNKVDGDFVEPTCQPQAIVADDLADIEKYNNTLHPRQKTFPGMTRRDVLLKHYNPKLGQLEPSYLYRFIGNETATSLRNNDYCVVANGEYELADFDALNRLKPNCHEVTAYWLPVADGSVPRVYLYQGDTYIGEAVDRGRFAYNECAVERTPADDAAMLHQHKRGAKFDKLMRDRRAEFSRVGRMAAAQAAETAGVEPAIVLEESTQPKGYEEDEFNAEDYTRMAIDRL